jgi:hypothetical protein
VIGTGKNRRVKFRQQLSFGLAVARSSVFLRLGGPGAWLLPHRFAESGLRPNMAIRDRKCGA